MMKIDVIDLQTTPPGGPFSQDRNVHTIEASPLVSRVVISHGDWTSFLFSDGDYAIKVMIDRVVDLQDKLDQEEADLRSWIDRLILRDLSNKNGTGLIRLMQQSFRRGAEQGRARYMAELRQLIGVRE